ncbi:MAG: DUF3467 domain-containing protein [Phycisphaeraceae bacterium]|nr:DUF3467 domain-containing protein [Phycisphaeraceae bacterium]
MPDEPTNTKVRMRVQDHNARAVYANAFRHNSTQNEIILDLGINTVTGRPPATDEGSAPDAEMLFQVDTRLVLNYDTARRLTGLLSQVIQQHDQRLQAAAAPQAAPPQPAEVGQAQPAETVS